MNTERNEDVCTLLAAHALAFKSSVKNNIGLILEKELCAVTATIADGR